MSSGNVTTPTAPSGGRKGSTRSHGPRPGGFATGCNRYGFVVLVRYLLPGRFVAALIQIFVSHSKDDPNLPFFAEAFAASPVKGVYMELEDIKPPPWSIIKEYVTRSTATFVLLSKPLRRFRYGHTRNWIDFEVGLSCAAGKPVWVFEPQGQKIGFAVPYCTYYCVYDPADPSEVKRVKRYIDMT